MSSCKSILFAAHLLLAIYLAAAGRTQQEQQQQGSNFDLLENNSARNRLDYAGQQRLNIIENANMVIGSKATTNNGQQQQLAPVNIYERLVAEGSTVRLSCPHVAASEPLSRKHQSTIKIDSIKWFKNHVPLANRKVFPPDGREQRHDDKGLSESTNQGEQLEVSDNFLDDHHDGTQAAAGGNSDRKRSNLSIGSKQRHLEKDDARQLDFEQQQPHQWAVGADSHHQRLRRRHLMTRKRLNHQIRRQQQRRQHHWYVSQFGELVIGNVSRHLAGKYTCLFGGQQSEVVLDVLAVAARPAGRSIRVNTSDSIDQSLRVDRRSAQEQPQREGDRELRVGIGADAGLDEGGQRRQVTLDNGAGRGIPPVESGSSPAVSNAQDSAQDMQASANEVQIIDRNLPDDSPDDDDCSGAPAAAPTHSADSFDRDSDSGEQTQLVAAPANCSRSAGLSISASPVPPLAPSSSQTDAIMSAKIRRSAPVRPSGQQVKQAKNAPQISLPAHVIVDETVTGEDLKNIAGILYTRQQFFCPFELLAAHQIKSGAYLSPLSGVVCRPRSDAKGERNNNKSLLQRCKSLLGKLLQSVLAKYCRRQVRSRRPQQQSIATSSTFELIGSVLEIDWAKDGRLLEFDRETGRGLNIGDNVKLIDSISGHGANRGAYGHSETTSTLSDDILSQQQRASKVFGDESTNRNDNKTTESTENEIEIGTDTETDLYCYAAAGPTDVETPLVRLGKGRLLEIDGLGKENAGRYSCTTRLSTSKLDKIIKSLRRRSRVGADQRDKQSFSVSSSSPNWIERQRQQQAPTTNCGGRSDSAAATAINDKLCCDKQNTCDHMTAGEIKLPAGDLSGQVAVLESVLLNSSASVDSGGGKEDAEAGADADVDYLAQALAQLEEPSRRTGATPKAASQAASSMVNGNWQTFVLLVTERSAITTNLWSTIQSANRAYQRRKWANFKRIKRALLSSKSRPTKSSVDNDDHRPSPAADLNETTAQRQQQEPITANRTDHERLTKRSIVFSNEDFSADSKLSRRQTTTAGFIGRDKSSDKLHNRTQISSSSADLPPPIKRKHQPDVLRAADAIIIYDQFRKTPNNQPSSAPPGLNQTRRLQIGLQQQLDLLLNNASERQNSRASAALDQSGGEVSIEKIVDTKVAVDSMDRAVHRPFIGEDNNSGSNNNSSIVVGQHVSSSSSSSLSATVLVATATADPSQTASVKKQRRRGALIEPFNVPSESRKFNYVNESRDKRRKNLDRNQLAAGRKDDEMEKRSKAHPPTATYQPTDDEEESSSHSQASHHRVSLRNRRSIKQTSDDEDDDNDRKNNNDPYRSKVVFGHSGEFETKDRPFSDSNLSIKMPTSDDDGAAESLSQSSPPPPVDQVGSNTITVVIDGLFGASNSPITDSMITTSTAPDTIGPSQQGTSANQRNIEGSGDGSNKANATSWTEYYSRPSHDAGELDAGRQTVTREDLSHSNQMAFGNRIDLPQLVPTDAILSSEDDESILWNASQYVYMHIKAFAASSIYGVQVDVEWSNERANGTGGDQVLDSAIRSADSPFLGPSLLAPFATIDVVPGQYLYLQCTAQALGRLPDIKWYKRVHNLPEHLSDSLIKRDIGGALFWPLTELGLLAGPLHESFVSSQTSTVFNSLANQTFTVVNSLQLSQYNDNIESTPRQDGVYNLYACIVDADVRHNYATLGVHLRRAAGQLPHDVTSRLEALKAYPSIIQPKSTNIGWIMSADQSPPIASQNRGRFNFLHDNSLMIPLKGHWIPIRNSSSTKMSSDLKLSMTAPVILSIMIALVFATLVGLLYLTHRAYQNLTTASSYREIKGPYESTEPRQIITQSALCSCQLDGLLIPNSDEIELLSSADPNGLHLHQQDKNNRFRHYGPARCNLNSCTSIHQECSQTSDNIASTRNIPSEGDDYYGLEMIDSKVRPLICCQNEEAISSKADGQKQSTINMFENPSCILMQEDDKDNNCVFDDNGDEHDE